MTATWALAKFRYAALGLLLMASFAYMVAGGSLREMLARNNSHLSMLKLQFAADANTQVELKRQAVARSNALSPASDWQSAYSRVQMALAPISSCPALQANVQGQYRLDENQQQELARWVENNSVIPICIERNNPDTASAYYGWIQKSVPGLSEKLIRLPSKMASAFVNRAFERFDSGDVKAAEADWSAAKVYLASSPYEVFGDVVDRVAAKHREAQQHFLNADLAAKPDSGVIRIYLAQAYNAASQGQEALDIITPALTTMPDDTRVWQQSAQALIGLNRIAEAEEALQKAVHLAPDDLQALNRLGVLYQATNQPERAEALFRQALATPNGSDAYWVWEHLGDVLLKQDKQAQAREAYKTAIAKAPLEAQASARKKLDDLNK